MCICSKCAVCFPFGLSISKIIKKNISCNRNQPISPNGEKFGRGCPGAVWSDGTPSEEYCYGKDANGKYQPENSWYVDCCMWRYDHYDFQSQCRGKPSDMISQEGQSAWIG